MVAPLSRLVAALPESVPFVAPEQLERRRGLPFRARLGANESRFGMSDAAARAMAQALKEAGLYGDPECWELRSALALRLGVDVANVVVASGIDELQGLTVRAFLDPGAVAVMSRGGYPTFAYHVEGFGGRLVTVPYREGRNHLDGLLEAVRASGARLVFLANPDNPTGSWIAQDELVPFLEELPSETLLVLDEAYLEFAPEQRLRVEAQDPRLIRLRTFSKAYGMAGLRVGYAIAARATLAAFERIRLHFGVNRIAQAGAVAALQDQAFLDRTLELVADGRSEYQGLAADLGLSWLPSAANFVTIDLGSPERASQAMAGLLQRGVFVRAPTAPPLDRYIRVTVGRPSERAIFAGALKETLAGLGPA